MDPKQKLVEIRYGAIVHFFLLKQEFTLVLYWKDY